ncbi:hypothetical protein [Segatella copri]|uniref:hypothetical protein n=1 Tax=Segatella copri TaxID=165179 RepID=UPI002230B81B|nr:hypothetical protein [Segatella copri]MCW4086584.1 hypothetical protein [Segatella copri]MCW4159140.1 hypothetical protein [Segatella copri]
MKHLRLILLLLAVCFTQISFSQDLAKKLESERILKSMISEILAEADTEQEAEEKISRLLVHDGEYITKQEKVNCANEYFEKCKKKLAKWDAKLAAGKKVYYEDAMYAANYYVLGFKKICNQDYSKALEYLKLCPQIPVTKMYTVALQYQLNKDKAAALAAMSFINKPSKQLSDVASQYGLEDVYHEKIMSLIADKKQTLKRAIRSKDFETLLSFIPYDIPVVDSLFATSNADIAIAEYVKDNTSYIRKIEEVEDFDDRNVIKIYKEGDFPYGYRNNGWATQKDDYKDYFINKCIFKHEMPWALNALERFDIEEIAKSYPVNLQMLALTIKGKMTVGDSRGMDLEYYKFYSGIVSLCSEIITYQGQHDNVNGSKREQDMLNCIKTFKSRNILASFLVAVMVQVNRYSSYFTPEFKMKLFNATKEIVDQVPSLKNNEALPVIISSNGKVTTKENCKSNEIKKKIYEPIMNLILAEYNKNKDK